MLIEMIRGLLRGPPDEYRVIRTGRNEDRAVIEKGLQKPPNPDQYIIENDLEPGTYRCQAIRDNRFAEVEWIRETGNPESLDEIDDLRRELREIRGAVESSSSREAPSRNFDDSLKKATFEGVLQGDLKLPEAKAIAELNAAFESPGGGLSDKVEDPTDLNEISARGVLEVLDGPGSFSEKFRGLGAAARFFEEGYVGDLQEEQEPDLDEADEEDEGRSREIDGGPTSLDELGSSLEDGEADLPVPEGDGASAESEAVTAEMEQALGDETDVEAEPAVADGGEQDEDEEDLAKEVADAVF